MAEITVDLMQRSVRVTESLEFNLGEARVLTRLTVLLHMLKRKAKSGSWVDIIPFFFFLQLNFKCNR